MEEIIFNCKVDFSLKQVLGITKREFYEDTMNTIKIKPQVKTRYVCLKPKRKVINLYAM